MIKGGYQILDFGGRDLSSAKTISGMHAKIAGTNKPFLASGMVYSTTAYKDTWLDFSLSGTSYVATLPDSKTITITNADACTIAS